MLVLVDGQRWVSGTAGSGIPGSVDLNTIPSAMIQKIEVLQESASPIYGSDAIAGVVNIITRRHQDGLDAYAQYGRFEEGDGETQDYGLTYGFSPGGQHRHRSRPQLPEPGIGIFRRSSALGVPRAQRHLLRRGRMFLGRSEWAYRPYRSEPGGF